MLSCGWCWQSSPRPVDEQSSATRENLCVECTHAAVTLLRLLAVSGENDQACLVGLQSVDIAVESLFASASCTVVDSNTDAQSFLLADTGSLDFLNRETAAFTELHVVADGWASNGRAE